MTKQKLIEKLKHKIIFLKNSSDSQIEDAIWKNEKESFASIEPICDNNVQYLEGVPFGNIVSEKYFLFTIRFMEGINNDMRIQFKERIFEIKRILNENEQNQILKIIALEIT